jgi:TM2 domain-containing membrane protein YozV
MNFYVGDGNQQRGPYTIDQLRGLGIRPDTLVWREGMSQWQPASTVAELRSILGSTTPGVPPIPPSQMGYASAPGHRPGSKRVLAGVMAIIFGSLGIHKFIMGYVGAGMVYLLITVLSIGIAAPIMHILAVVEGIIYLCKSDQEFDQMYVVGRKAWF